ncbi:hypothetical protein SERLADRAFT_346323, partial [Serpula lacrymans var. lacrymans S7.9]
GLPVDIVPIIPSTTQFKYTPTLTGIASGKSYSIVCTQLPLLPAYAYTDYKVQGQSLKKVILDLTGCRSLQSVYIMLSCATSLAGVAIMRLFKIVCINQYIGQ